MAYLKGLPHFIKMRLLVFFSNAKMMDKLFIIFLSILYLPLLAQDYSQSPWHIQATEIDPANYFGITVANGMVGLVSSPEPMQVQDVVLNGVYDYYQRGRVSNILKTFNHVNMTLAVNGSLVTRKNIANYTQTLDMQHAKLTTTFDVGTEVSVKHTLISLRHLPYTALTVVEITAKKEVTIRPSSEIFAPDHLTNVHNYYSEFDQPHLRKRLPLLSSIADSPSGKLKVAAAASFIFEEPVGSEPDVFHENRDFNNHAIRFNKKLKAGETYTFSVVGSVTSSKDYDDPVSEAGRLTIYAMLEGRERLLERHEATWDVLWKTGDIIVEGNVNDQRDIRSALYHLYAFARAGTAYSLSPMGLSGLGYNGHVFWDTEIWMYPPLLILQPEIAKSLLEYRFQRLEAAKQNAFAHGYKGAMFPWESSDQGAEDTPVWALTGPFEHHITGDVGWAFWKYYQVTKDKTWLRERGYPVLKEVADFWASRVERNALGRYEINKVVGANEYQEDVDNNAFTNGVAITVLRYATQAAKELGLPPNPDWNHVADNIPILKFPDGVTRENATYNGEMIKQADANLLAFPLKIVSQEADIRRDLAYYEPRIDKNGPAMGNSVLAALHARLGDTAKAYDLWVKSYQANQVPPFGVLAETAGGTNPYFATGAGGMLQAVMMGIGGLDITDEGLVQLPTKLPNAWKSLTIIGAGKDDKAIKVN